MKNYIFINYTNIYVPYATYLCIQKSLTEVAQREPKLLVVFGWNMSSVGTFFLLRVNHFFQYCLFMWLN